MLSLSLSGKLGQVSATDALPDLEGPEPVQQSATEEEERQDMERMQAALDGLLRS